jgi:hypothetical protein
VRNRARSIWPEREEPTIQGPIASESKRIRVQNCQENVKTLAEEYERSLAERVGSVSVDSALVFGSCFLLL